MPEFKLSAPFKPTGDQPEAIAKLVEGVRRGDKFQTLLGVTGSGKTFTLANVIAEIQRPTLVIAHNKTLAAQLCSEFREFFPENAVGYFVSYYDYYQPEAYIPQTDTYIEKDASINDEIERLRYSATQAVLERRDAIVVASVSCIYGLGSPSEYKETILTLEVGQGYRRDDVLRRLVDMQFSRNDIALGRGTFRVRGDVLEIQPMHEEIVTRIEFFGDEVERVTNVDPLTGEVIAMLDKVSVFPASHFITPYDKLELAITNIEKELAERLEFFHSRNMPLEAERIEMRTRYDIEMMREVGYCSGIENYSRHLDFRAPGTPPYTLIDYFPEDYFLIIDESHQTIPQLNGMYNGDRSRKETLVEFGFRLPSALDNRPLRFEEFEGRMGQVIFNSATPSAYELKHSAQIVEQLIRPTYVIDPELEVRPTKHQIDDLVEEIRTRTEKSERVLVTTLTKKMAEDLSEYLLDLGVKVHYLHSEIQTLERIEILRDLRLGVYDVIVGINLLREGLDLPEVSLVAILDADRQGFLRSETSLVQTIGRAARNATGKVLMYADQVTDAMRKAIDETNRRRAAQSVYNEEHGVSPETVQKAVGEAIRARQVAETRARYGVAARGGDAMSLDDIMLTLTNLEKEMRAAAKALEFEHAAEVRDEILRIKKLLPDVKW